MSIDLRFRCDRAVVPIQANDKFIRSVWETDPKLDQAFVLMFLSTDRSGNGPYISIRSYPFS